MLALIIGSIAYDTILHYDGNLKKSIDKETIDWKINMSVRVPECNKQSGWTGLNISYNLALLEEKSVLLWAIWHDFEFTNFVQEHVNLNYIFRSELLASSSSFISLDDFWNQLSVFYPWAMLKADYMRIDNIHENISHAIISPTKKEAMFQYLEWLHEEWIKIFFDPGQQLSIMDKNDLKIVWEKADYLILNEHEFSLFQKILGLSEKEIYWSFEKVIVTYWEKGSKIIDTKEIIDIPVVEVQSALDSTWVWEAYRAGLLKGILSGKWWETSWKIWALLASFCMESNGGQNHFIDSKQFKMLFLEEFWEELEL